MTVTFELQVANQHWLGDPGEQSRDGCSHGAIRAVIGGVRVTSDEVVGFAEAARSFYFSAEPRTLEEWEKDFHEQFWSEFHVRLQRAKSARPRENSGR